MNNYILDLTGHDKMVLIKTVHGENEIDDSGYIKLEKVALMQYVDFQWFIEHYQELYEKYGCSYIVIKNKTVLGTYSNFREAVDATSLTENVGTFIVQECSGDESAYTMQLVSVSFT